jgi:hypothetical protein
MTTSITESFGLTPINVNWTIVRGDTAELKVEFLENDESTSFLTEGWEYASSTYDFKGDVIDELIVQIDDSGITLIASPDITQYWGVGYGSPVAELAFDLQVTHTNKIWTPIVGIIKVIGDVTSGGL